MTTATKQTVQEWLQELANGDTSTDADERKMNNLLKSLHFDNAIVVYGIVYLDGQGTIQNPPMAIQQMAKHLLDAMEVAKDWWEQVKP